MTNAAPDGWHTITPRIFTSDVADFVEFRRRVFNATGEYHTVRPREMGIGDSLIMVSGKKQREAWRVFVRLCGGGHATYQAALTAGAKSLQTRAMSYGDRRGIVREPWGNTWQIATRL